MMKFFMGIGLIAFLLVLVANGLALTINPAWAVKRSWCLLNDDKMQRQMSMFNLDYNPSILQFRETGIVLLFFVSMILHGLFGDADNPAARAVWTVWVSLMVFMTSVQGVAWAFSPRWLLSRFPTLNHGYSKSRLGRVFMRLVGLLMLAAVSLYFLFFAVSSESA